MSVTMAAAPDIEVRGVSKSYGSALAVDDVSFTVERGHVLSLLGPSGCGKTTTMRMIAGLIDPSAGDIEIKGKSVTGIPVHRRNIGLLFQNYALFPHLNVAGNVAFGLEMRKLPKDDIRQKVLQALALVKLEAFADRMPHQMSGGQQQRVALARALVIEPAVLLLDEPLGALDKKLRESMQIELRLLQQRLNITTLMVTHDQEEALTLSDRIAVMRDGKIEQFGEPNDIYEKPVSRFVANFIGVSNFFQGQVSQRHGDAFSVMSEQGVLLTIPGVPPNDPSVLVALRPESIRLLPAGTEDGPNRMRAVIDQVIYRGLNTQYLLRRPDGEPLIVMRQNDDGGGPVQGLGHGAAVVASWDAERNRVVRDA
jgi:putative spermidine/putrescine transport system ATP-binding protein